MSLTPDMVTDTSVHSVPSDTHYDQEDYENELDPAVLDQLENLEIENRSNQRPEPSRLQLTDSPGKPYIDLVNHAYR